MQCCTLTCACTLLHFNHRLPSLHTPFSPFPNSPLLPPSKFIPSHTLPRPFHLWNIVVNDRLPSGRYVQKLYIVCSYAVVVWSCSKYKGKPAKFLSFVNFLLLCFTLFPLGVVDAEICDRNLHLNFELQNLERKFEKFPNRLRCWEPSGKNEPNMLSFPE